MRRLYQFPLPWIAYTSSPIVENGVMPTESTFAGDAIPGASQIIEVRVGGLRQLFNAIDPSPFHERDLDPRAEEFIVDWSRDLPRDAPLALVVHLERGAGRADEAVILREAIHEFFSQRAASSRRSLRELFRRGRISLAIGLAFLAASIAVGDGLSTFFTERGWPDIVGESLLIGGWVAMWRPLEVFLYDWWPIRAEARLFDRLSSMPVKILYTDEAAADAWRLDWPSVPAAGDHASTVRPSPASVAGDTIVPKVLHEARRDQSAPAHAGGGAKNQGGRS
jgi:hypothetical protein